MNNKERIENIVFESFEQHWKSVVQENGDLVSGDPNLFATLREGMRNSFAIGYHEGMNFMYEELRNSGEFG